MAERRDVRAPVAKAYSELFSIPLGTGANGNKEREAQG